MINEGHSRVKVKEIYVVACCYDVPAESVVNKFNRLGGSYKFRGVIVINNHKLPVPESNDDWQYILGSNKEFEFSAYREGLNILICNSSYTNEPILIINDTLLSRHSFKYTTKSILKNTSTIQRLSLPAMAGKIDPYNNICYSNPWSSLNIYISSYCMLINKPAVDIFIKCIDSINDYFENKSLDLLDPCWGGRIDLLLKEFILSHLLDNETDTAWYQAGLYQNDTTRLNKKARCVFLEHYLSGCIGKQGVLVSAFPTWKSKVLHFLAEQNAKLTNKIGVRK
jgi:hypothetical protein